MFERTMVLLRRLTGKPDPALALAEPGDERRLWVRYPTNVPTFFEPTNGRSGEGRLSAVIRDISLAGIQLLVDRPFDPGSLLSVELPTREGERRTVLACVVHCRKVGEGQWAAGCSFSRELSDDDLETFQASRTRPAGNDNRHWERYDCRVTATCQVVAAGDQAPWTATVQNISANGMALQTDRDLPPGALLSAELHGSGGKPPVSILACVVHVLSRDGERVFGCNFIRELSEQDLAALV